MTIQMTKKMCLLGSAALAAMICVPVMANHNNLPLRGSWNGGNWNGDVYAMPASAIVPTRQQYASQYPAYAPHATELQSQSHYNYSHQRPQNQAQHSNYAPQPYGQTVYLTPQAAPKRTLGNLFGLRGRSKAVQPRAYAEAPSAGHSDSRYDIGSLSVRTSTAHTDRMLDWQENTTGKALTILQHRRNGILAPNSLYLGAGIKGGLMWQKTEVPGQFPLLSRFPFFSNRTDDQSGVFAINNAAMAITGTFGDWTTIYLQPEYSETDFAGDQDEMQLRKAFVTFGNLDKSPFYAAFGRKTIDFGNFDGYNPFTQTEAQHYFWAMSDQPVLELGFYDNGLKITASAFSAGRQLRTAYAGEENNIGNYAASIEKEFLLNNGGSFTLGSSYLHDTIYRNNFTAHTFAGINNGTPPANFIEYRNSAVSAFAEYNSDVLDLMLEYTTTMEPWAAAIPQDAAGTVNPAYLNADGSINFDENLSVTVAQARYKPRAWGGRTAISAVGSWGNIGDDDYVGMAMGQNVTFGKNQQHVLGLEHKFSPYVDFGVEYVYNKGFIPFVAPQLVSNQETEAHAINVGFKARF